MANSSRILVLVAACLLFFAIGLHSAIGPVLPDIARNTGSTLAEAGILFSALFVGALVTQAASGPLTDRFGVRRLLFAGCLVVATGMLGVTLSNSLPLTMAFMVFEGLGDGTLIVLTNVLVVETFSGRRLAALNLSNVFFGLGAMAGPALAAYSLEVLGTAVPALWALVLTALLAAPLILLIRLPVRPVPEGSEATAGSIYRSPLLLALGAVLLLYVGTEIGIGGWGATYMTRTTSMDIATANLVVSGFWVAFTGGRILGAALSTALGPNILLTSSFVGTLAGSLLFAAGQGNTPLTLAGLMLMAVALGPVFPTVVALATGLFRQNAARVTGAIVVMGTMGGLVLPWLHGLLLLNLGPPVYAFFLVFSTSLMLASYWLSRRAERSRT